MISGLSKGLRAGHHRWALVLGQPTNSYGVGVLCKTSRIKKSQVGERIPPQERQKPGSTPEPGLRKIAACSSPLSRANFFVGDGFCAVPKLGMGEILLTKIRGGSQIRAYSTSIAGFNPGTRATKRSVDSLRESGYQNNPSASLPSRQPFLAQQHRQVVLYKPRAQ